MQSAGPSQAPQAQASAVAPADQLESVSFTYHKVERFATQFADSDDIKFIKLSLKGAGISSTMTNDLVNGDPFVPVTGGNATATISAVPRVAGSLRVVTAQGFDANKQPLPAFIGKGIYRSASNLSQVPVVISRRFVLTGLALELLMLSHPNTAASININALQIAVEQATGYNSATDSFSTDPDEFDPQALSTLIANLGSVPTSTQILDTAHVAPGNVSLGFTTPHGGAFGEPITLTVNDPTTPVKTIALGSNSPQNKSFQVGIGNWTLTAKKANGTVVGQTAVSVSNTGTVGLGANPLMLTGILEIPVITELSAESADPGTPLTISGGGFDTNPLNNIVTFGTTVANVTAASTSSLTVTVPNGLLGTQNISVAVNGQTSNLFAFGIKPKVDSLSVTSGVIDSELTITGSNFDPTPANNIVRFGVTTATVLSGSGTSLTVKVPAGISFSQNVFVTTGGQTNAEVNNFAVTPTVSSLTPNNGASGNSIQISGTGFNSNPVNDIVKFGTTVATVTSATATLLTVTVPTLPMGTHNVSVTVGSQTNSETNSFSVKPGITNLSAASGVIGSSITISGTNFDPTPDNNLVKFGEVEADVTAATANSLTVTVPEMLASTQNVTVTVNSQTNNGVHNFEVLPTLATLSDTSGSLGSTITISGFGFDPTPANNTVRFGNATAVVTAATANSLTVTVPQGISGSVNVKVTVAELTSNILTFTIRLAVTGLSADHGVIGTSLTINGVGFSQSAISNTVRFVNGNTTVTAPVITATTSSLTVNVPSGINGTQNVTVTVGNQTSSETNTFAVTPTISTLSPGSGEIDSSVTIGGTGFSTTKTNNIVKFGTVEATVTAATATSLTATVPDGVSGTQNVSVTVDTQTSNETFTYTITSGITDLSATSGIIGSSLTITGTNFDPDIGDNLVKFGTTVATVTAASATSLTVTVPDMTAGTQNLTVTANGSTSGARLFNVLPSVSNLSVSSGTINSDVTITGTGFDPTFGNNTVKFGTQTALVFSGTSTSLLVKVPAGIGGHQFVTVTVGGQDSTESMPFDVVPLITSLSPSTGGSGTTVTIGGQGFDPTPTNNLVEFNGIDATVTAGTTTSLTVTAPNLAQGDYDVTVTVNGFVNSGTHTFSNTTTSITSLSAATGAIGTSLTINGGGFDTTPGNNTVKFGTTVATVTAASATSLTVTVPEMTAGTYNVTVTVGGSTNGGTNNFGVQPRTTGLSVGSGIAGSSVTVSGLGFDPTLTTNNTVKFGTVSATVTNATATSLTVTVPSGIGNSKNVTVTVGGQTSTDTTPFEVIPVITSLNSTTGIVGSFVTITGTGFDNSAVGNNIVKFGNTTGTVQSVTGSTSMSVQVAGIAGPQTVRLTIGNQINAETNFSYTIKTTLLSMTAASGACSPNCNGIITSTLTLTGAGFDYETPSNNIVTFNHTSAPTNTTQATVSAATATTLTVTVPEGIYGSQNVLVTVNSQTNTGTHIFGVKPLISQLSPTSGNTSDTILMTGTGFDPNAPANNFVKFVGLGASITVTNPTTTSLNFSVPNVVAGNYNVTVQVGTVTSASSPFTHN